MVCAEAEGTLPMRECNFTYAGVRWRCTLQSVTSEPMVLVS